MATTRRATALATAAALALVGAACASEADPGEYADVITDANDQATTGESATGGAGDPTTQALASAADQSADEAYRVTMSIRLEVSGAGPDEDVSVDADLMTGEFDGGAYETRIDMGTAIAQMNASAGDSGGEFDGIDLTMDIVGDDEVAFIRAPIFAELGDVEAAEDEGFSVTDDPEAFAQLAELGDDWGRIEVTEIEGLAPGDMAGSLTGGGMGDPLQMLDTLGQGTDAEDLGTDEIDGVEVEGTGFRLSYSDLVGDQALSGSGSEGMDDDEAAEFADAMFGDIPVEAWVDGDGYVRRISYELDMSAMFEAFGELEDDGGDEGSGDDDMPDTFTMGASVDFTDYGDPGIEIELPDDADAVDVTDAFEAIVEGD